MIQDVLLPNRHYYVVSGDRASLSRLVANFDSGSPRVFAFRADTLLESDELQDRQDFDAAEQLLRSMTGSMMLAGLPCQRVSITGGVLQVPDGPLQLSAIGLATIGIGTFISSSATVLNNGVPQPIPRSLASRIQGWLPASSDEARGLHQILAKGDPDWRDIHLLIEILTKLDPQIKANGLVERIRRTAGNWKVLGPDARHYEMGHQPPPNPPTLGEARKVILGLVKDWFNQMAPP